jgi:hypothetical protein
MKIVRSVFVLLVIVLVLALPIRVLAGSSSVIAEAVVSSSNIYGGSVPDVAWGNNTFGVVFEDSRDGNNEIYFSQLDKNGNKIGQDTRVTTTPANDWNPTIAWDGHNFGVFWYDVAHGGADVLFVKISPSGVLLSPNIVIADDGSTPSVAWNNEKHEYGLAWYADNVGIGPAGADFVRLDSEGNKLSPIASLNTSTQGGSGKPSIATSGQNYAVGWSDNRGCSDTCKAVVLALIDGSGLKIGSEHQFTTDGSVRLHSLVWNGKEYGMAAIGDSGPELLTASSSGSLSSENILTGPFQHPNKLELLWYNNSYILSFSDRLYSNGEGNDDPILAKYDKQGSLVGDFIRANSGSGLSWQISKPVRSTNGFSVVWDENLYDPSQNISFSKVNL